MGGECDDEGIQLGFQNQAEMNTIPITVDSFYCSRASFGCVLQDNVVQGSNSNSSQMENYPLGVNFDEIFLPKISMLDSGRITEFVQDDVEVALNGKRKRNLKLSPSHEVPEKDQHGHCGEAFGKNEVGILSATQTSKQQYKHQDEEARKQNYVHVRAKRGQATNSHSIAERVRREKISERMRLLQELVPGCNKITGKAVMLDEIINYVQSLQHQVEFLSMKLAAASPELNFDIDHQVPPKDIVAYTARVKWKQPLCDFTGILHSRGNDPSFIGFNQAMSSSHGLYHGNLTTMPNALAQYHHLSQAVWEGDVQNFLHMGFELGPNVSNLGSNGM